MRKSILMASFLLATLYACNQEEEALKTLKPTDGGEVMTTASGTLTPAELLAQDSLMMAYFMVSMQLGNDFVDDTIVENGDLVTDTVFIAENLLAWSNLTTGYAGFAGMSEGQMSNLISDAYDVILDGVPGLESPQPPGETPLGCKAYRKCVHGVNEAYMRAGAREESTAVFSLAWNDWVDGLADCCLANKRACRNGCRGDLF